MGIFDFLSKKPSNEDNGSVKVKEIMTPNPIVMPGTATIAQIEEIFNKNNFWSIYVGDPDNYIGIITRDDLKFRVKNKSKSSPAFSIMSKGVLSIDENADVKDAETLLYSKKINGLAVTRNGIHCGIITRYDIKNKKPKSAEFSEKITTHPNAQSPSSQRDGMNWIDEEILTLIRLWGEGKSIQIISNILERSTDAVVHKLIDIGLIGYNDDECYPRPTRFGLTWNEHEKTQLISEYNTGRSIPEIARIHQRNKNTILHNLVKLQIINYQDRSLLEKYSENFEEYNDKSVPDNNQLIRTLISELEINDNADFRNSAATQLGSFHEPSVVDTLLKCVKDDPKVRYRALAALRNIGDPLAIPVFIERSKDPSARIRLVSVNALGEIGDSTVIKHLESLIKSKDYQNILKFGGNPEIIQAAREAIQKIRSRDHQINTPMQVAPESDLKIADLSPQETPNFVIERTIFDPVSGTFFISRDRPLVNVEDWIQKNDPNSYWFILCIHNNSNTLIDEWGIELDSSSSLKTIECHIEGMEHTPALTEFHPVPWQSRWTIGIPRHFGITLPRGGSRRLYFKLSSSTCGVSHSITGNLIAPGGIQIPIMEKTFNHSCDVATLSTAISKNQDAAEQYTENFLMRSYPKETALKYIQSFKLVQEISQSCAIGNHDVTVDKLNQLIDALEGTQASRSLIESVKNDLWAIKELGDTEDASTRVQRLCRNIVDDWLNEVIYKQKKLG